MKTLSGIEITNTDPYRRKYYSAMAEYLCSADSFNIVADEDTGSIEWVVYAQRWGKRILFEDSYGFVTVENYGSVDAAEARLAEIDAAYGEWLSQDDSNDEGI